MCLRFGHHIERYLAFLTRFGGDLLSNVLRRSTIGATALNGRVREGIGCFARAMTTKPGKTQHAKSSMIFVYAFDFSQQFQGQPLLLLDQIKPVGQLVPVN